MVPINCVQLSAHGIHHLPVAIPQRAPNPFPSSSPVSITPHFNHSKWHSLMLTSFRLARHEHESENKSDATALVSGTVLPCSHTPDYSCLAPVILS